MKTKAVSALLVVYGTGILALDLAGQMQSLFALRDATATGLGLFWGLEFVARCANGLKNGYDRAKGSVAARMRKAGRYLKMYILDRVALYAVALVYLAGATAAKKIFVGTILESPGTIVHTLAVASVFFWLVYDATQWTYNLFRTEDMREGDDVDFITTFMAVGRALREGNVEGAAEKVDELSPETEKAD